MELKQFGYTKGCPGCDAAMNGRRAVQHSDACRSRIEQAMSQRPQGQPKLEASDLKMSNKMEEMESKQGTQEEATADDKATAMDTNDDDFLTEALLYLFKARGPARARRAPASTRTHAHAHFANNELGIVYDF